MKRIGITASKISKGNIFLYNLYVVIISMLFSLFIFVVAGATVIFALTIISRIADEVMTPGSPKDWRTIMTMCMVSLTVVVALFNMTAITLNIKLPKMK
jgi:lysylphosphatidylglycerol synthetase-like protein (DUF2156 family)